MEDEVVKTVQYIVVTLFYRIAYSSYVLQMICFRFGPATGRVPSVLEAMSVEINPSAIHAFVILS